MTKKQTQEKENLKKREKKRRTEYNFPNNVWSNKTFYKMCHSDTQVMTEDFN